MDEPNIPITPHPTTPPTSPPQPDTPPSHSSTPIPTSAQTQSHAQTVYSHIPVPINNSSQTMSTHPMVTRAKADIFKPLERMNCQVTTTLPLPRSHVHALRDPNWKEAMLDKNNALITNRTWVLVSRPANVNVVRSMWLFKHKFNADGSLSRYKARLVANGRNQQQGIDCDETFSLVVKPATIRTVLSLAISRDWPIHQLDVKNAFLYGQISEIVICTSWVTLSRSSIEAEYQGVANIVAETAWIYNLLHELHTPLFTAIIVYCDNVSDVYMPANLVQHQRTKRIKIDIHFVRDFVASGQVHVLHVPSRFQYAYIFTKGLPTALFIEFRSSLNV
ncbi:ribonuclease H-like domain-containing protein [Tanacetum coccineum]